MTKREFHHFFDLSHLLSRATDVVISNVVHVLLLFFALDWISFTVKHSLRRNDASRRRIRIDDLNVKHIKMKNLKKTNLEFHSAHCSLDSEDIPSADRSIILQKVWLQEHFKQISEMKISGGRTKKYITQ